MNKKKEKNTDKALEVLEREGLLNAELKERITQPKPSSLWTALAQKILFLGLALAKDKIYAQFFAGEEQVAEKKEIWVLENIWGLTNLKGFWLNVDERLSSPHFAGGHPIHHFEAAAEISGVLVAHFFADGADGFFGGS